MVYKYKGTELNWMWFACFTGAVDSIRDYYHQSAEAKNQVNTATTGTHSPVEQSAGLRQATEARMDAVKGDFELKQRVGSELLKTLNQELEQEDLSQLSQKVNS